jgi:PIN domain nuclease of toxin-antitoxin system
MKTQSSHIRIGEGRRIVLPSEVCESMSLGVGDTIFIRVEDNQETLSGVVRTIKRSQALLAVAFNEAGRKMVMKQLSNAIVSAVTHQEVVTKLLCFDIPIREIDMFLNATFPNVIPVDRQQANFAAQLHHEYRSHRFSASECSCVALVKHQGLTLLASDAKWAEISQDFEVKLCQ